MGAAKNLRFTRTERDGNLVPNGWLVPLTTVAEILPWEAWSGAWAGTVAGAGVERTDQSSRSLRLGVRLGSLARKPNTKIPMKKKTTE